MDLDSVVFIEAIKGDRLSPQLSNSTRYKHWLTVEDYRRCIECELKHGKVFKIEEQNEL